MTPAALLNPEFRFSIKEANNQVPEPIEGIDYFTEDKFNCTVAFEINVPGHEDEDEIDIECRAYEAIKNGGDLECLGVMMKEKAGTVCRDPDGKPFDREVWINQKTDELKIIRTEKPLSEFI